MSRPVAGFRFAVLGRSAQMVNQVTVEYQTQATPDAAPLLHQHILYDTASGSLALRGLLELINSAPAVYTRLNVTSAKVAV